MKLIFKVLLVLLVFSSVFVWARTDWVRGYYNQTIVSDDSGCGCNYSGDNFTGDLANYFLYLNTSNDPLTSGLRINTTNNVATHLRLIDSNPSFSFGYGIANYTFTIENQSGHKRFYIDELGYTTWQTREIKNGVQDYPFKVKIPDISGLTNNYYEVWKLYLRDGGSGVGGRGYETRSDYFAPTNSIDNSGGGWMLFYNTYTGSYTNWMGIGVTGGREGTHGLFNVSFIATNTNGANVKKLPMVFMTHGLIVQTIYPNGSMAIGAQLENNPYPRTADYDVETLKIYANSREGFFNDSKLTYWVDNESNEMASFTSDGNFEIYDGATWYVNGSFHVGLTSPGLTSNTTYTLPVTDGSNGTTLHTNGTSNLYWAYYPDESFACSAGTEGMIIYNTSSHKHLGCNSTHWNTLY